MKRRWTSVTLGSILVMIVAVALPFTPAVPQVIRSPVDLKPLESRLEALVQEEVYPGAAIIVGRGDQVLLERYFGNYRIDTKVQVASAGKWLAAATIARLVDEGKLGWDDPAGKWVPELTGQMARATLRQLLSHTRGILIISLATGRATIILH